jgi:hypothetical protein
MALPIFRFFLTFVAGDASRGNGPAEGQINGLKALKRQMYGRAGLELLRARLLPLPVVEINDQVRQK